MTSSDVIVGAGSGIGWAGGADVPRCRNNCTTGWKNITVFFCRPVQQNKKDRERSSSHLMRACVVASAPASLSTPPRPPTTTETPASSAPASRLITLGRPESFQKDQTRVFREGKEGTDEKWVWRFITRRFEIHQPSKPCVFRKAVQFLLSFLAIYFDSTIC